MVTYVLDSSALLRFLENEAGAERVSDIIKAHLEGSSQVMISAPHWGEVAGITCKKRSQTMMELVLSRLHAFAFVLVPADADRAVRAALIKLKRNIPFVDAFGIELAAEQSDRVFVTADYDFKPASRDVVIEFLPAK